MDIGGIVKAEQSGAWEEGGNPREGVNAADRNQKPSNVTSKPHHYCEPLQPSQHICEYDVRDTIDLLTISQCTLEPYVEPLPVLSNLEMKVDRQ